MNDNPVNAMRETIQELAMLRLMKTRIENAYKQMGMEIHESSLAAAVEETILRYEAKVQENADLRKQNCDLRIRLDMKNNALDSYAEFYGKAAGLAGLPDYSLPSEESDMIILQRLAEHDEIDRLRNGLMCLACGMLFPKEFAQAVLDGKWPEEK